MSNASWTPNETPDVIFTEKTWLQGAILTGVGYGIVFTLYCMTARALLVGLKRSDYKKIGWLVYITIMFFLGSIFMGACSQMTQLSFIDYRNIPGGPSEYENVEFSIPADEAGNVVFVLTNWFADGLMVWRCVLIYRGCSIPAWVTGILPCLMYLAEFVLGLLWLIQISAPAGSPYLAGGNINWTLPYLSTAVALNVVVTAMIATRLLLYRRRVVSVLGGKHGRHYISVAAMVIESAALYSAFALLFIIPFAINNSIANTFLQALSEVQIIAPLLIIYRVAQGKAWSSDTARQTLSTFKARDPTSTALVSLSGSGMHAPSTTTNVSSTQWRMGQKFPESVTSSAVTESKTGVMEIQVVRDVFDGEGAVGEYDLKPTNMYGASGRGSV